MQLFSLIFLLGVQPALGNIAATAAHQSSNTSCKDAVSLSSQIHACTGAS